MMVTVRRVVCALAAALCCTALCVAAAADALSVQPVVAEGVAAAGGGGESPEAALQGIKAAIAKKEAEVQTKKGAYEEARGRAWDAKVAVSALEKARVAVSEAADAMKSAVRNANTTKVAAIEAYVKVLELKANVNKLNPGTTPTNTEDAPKEAAKKEDVKTNATAMESASKAMLVSAEQTKSEAEG
ncbi:hypothetical protein DQ04_02951040 [Trypanosoma grayi]|uniref:hypothetical protein n=1 Tax=Trypanosoma grayi TaxID=71804 RepID=UPI0004F496A0|nr:hypothetical protein DQ04_02951040 [Trypanosoma grayi]KEG11126.1 hypothetical protein DQ04_02951040 [Trypanosoma grayi]